MAWASVIPSSPSSSSLFPSSWEGGGSPSALDLLRDLAATPPFLLVPLEERLLSLRWLLEVVEVEEECLLLPPPRLGDFLLVVVEDFFLSVEMVFGLMEAVEVVE